MAASAVRARIFAEVTASTSPGANLFAEASGLELDSPSAWLTVVGRLPEGSDPGEARSRLGALLGGTVSAGSELELTGVNTASLPEVVRPGVIRFARLIGLTVGLLLLIGCVAVGALLLVRTESRQDEFAVSLALGGSASRLARSVAVEGALLALAGGLFALPLVQWIFFGVRVFELPGRVQMALLDLRLDFEAVGAAIGAAVGVTLLITLMAGVFVFSVNVSDCLRIRAAATPRLSRRRVRTVLVVSQVAVAIVLLAGTGLFARSIAAAPKLNPDLETRRILTGVVRLPSDAYSREQAAPVFSALWESLSRSPEIESASMLVPYGGMTTIGQIVVDGEPRSFSSFVEYSGIDEFYFRTLGVQVSSGRDFSRFDDQRAPRVAIVTESLDRILSEGGTSVGRLITESSYSPPDPPDVIEVVGVVPDAVSDVTLLQPLVIYMPGAQLNPRMSREIIVRAAGDTNAAARAVVNALAQFDDAALTRPMLTIDDQLVNQLGAQRFGMHVMGGLGMIAGLLAALAVYVIAETISTGRRREMGIRAALGARGWQLSSIVLSESLRLVGLGIATGLLMAWLGSGAIRALLFGIEPMDWVTLTSVAGLTFLLALAVSLKPALAAARVDAASTLREQ